MICKKHKLITISLISAFFLGACGTDKKNDSVVENLPKARFEVDASTPSWQKDK